MFLPLIMGSDKTTVSVTTGNQEFHLFYGSPGVISGIAWCSHGSSVLPYAMLPIPKGFKFIKLALNYILTEFSVAKRHQETPAFKKFARQLYHECLTFNLSLLKDGMTTPVIMRCPCGLLSTNYLWARTVYCQLSWAGMAGMHCQGWCPKYALIFTSAISSS